jgi:RND family efflux transporter MFP subunit
MRKLILFILVVTVASLVGWRLQSVVLKKGAGAVGRAPIAVTCGVVTRGDMNDVAEFTGTLKGKAEVIVSPKISGRVSSILVDLGDAVHKDQLLVTLDDEEAKHAVAEAKAKLVVARASLDEYDTTLATAQHELERIRTLRERKVAAVSELEAAEAEVSRLLARKKVAEAGIVQQEAAHRAAEARLSYTQILSPIDGYVGKRYIDEGAMLSVSTPILSLADISSVKTQIGIVEKDYVKIQVGLEANLTFDAYPGQVFEGRISRIAPILDHNTRTAETEIEVLNPDLLLKPGMFTRVQIHFGVHEDVLLVPSQALVKRESREGIFVPDQNNTAAKFVEVKKILSDATRTEVTGVEEGVPVVVLGQHLLNDGDAIIISATAEQ